MRCPTCHHRKSKVLETRGDLRRRECLRCGTRWNTREEIVVETIRRVSNAEAWRIMKGWCDEE